MITPEKADLVNDDHLILVLRLVSFGLLLRKVMKARYGKSRPMMLRTFSSTPSTSSSLYRCVGTL
ncbi:hypothetical protein M758_10G142000 [Ceratodon purpureus]|nr:hypothetical protein M758_10G142000 [Ceratodon purpureus]